MMATVARVSFNATLFIHINLPNRSVIMKKTAVLSAVALAIGLGAATSGFAADNRIGVTIYKYDDNFMSLMRKKSTKKPKH